MTGRTDLAFGLASSVGPVPFGSTVDAVQFAFSVAPRFPTVPVTTEASASLLAQAVHGLAGVVLDGPALSGQALVANGTLPSSAEAAATGRRLDAPAFDALRATAAALSPAGRSVEPAAVRLPVLGPVTLSRSLRAAGHPAADADRVAVATVSARAVTSLSHLQRSIGDATTVVVVLCEPGLVGSAHPTFPLLPSEVRSLLDPVVDALDAAVVADAHLIGVHVPGPCDLPSVVGSGASVLGLPVDRSLVGWASLLGDYLERGGRLCWGVVPVDRPFGTSTEPHWRRLIELWTSLVAEGVDPMLLRLRSSFSPADGLAHFAPAQAELVMSLTSGVAERVGHQAVAARLSLGA